MYLAASKIKEFFHFQGVWRAPERASVQFLKNVYYSVSFSAPLVRSALKPRERVALPGLRRYGPAR